MAIPGKVIALGVAGYFITAGGAYLYAESRPPVVLPPDEIAKRSHIRCSGCCVSLDDKKRLETYNMLASTYDDQIDRDEFFMGLKLIRRWHLSQARGNVLEVGCGTGRNFSYYTRGCQQVLAVDAADKMVKVAHKKVVDLGPKQRPVITVDVMDAHNLTVPTASMDTVVDTFGLCSFEDPVSALREMARVLRPESGRLLLLEHGRGTYNWMNRQLDLSAVTHAANWGCVFNRDILTLVAAAGLVVEDSSRWHFGTTYVLTCRLPTPEELPAVEVAATAAAAKLAAYAASPEGVAVADAHKTGVIPGGAADVAQATVAASLKNTPPKST